ncbi:hypothetical protein H0A64_15455 [Alcaligenaceae bacterium]|nr:hypothetical protein [Alcaligenaceae bacterium]
MIRQHGFALMELVVAAMLAMLLAVWGASALMNRITDARAESAAVWMLSVRQALHAYIDRYADDLRHADGPASLSHKGYADWAAPTLAQLKADQLLSPGFPELAYFGGASLRLWRHGACPGADCRVDALVHGNQPVRGKAGGIDEQTIAQWTLSSKGYGGAVSQAQPQYIRGPAFAFNNPSWDGEPLLPGIVAMAVTSEQSSQREFLRVGDTRNPDFKGGATIEGDVHAMDDLHVGRYLRLQSEHAMFAPCAQEGDVARNPDSGLLVCRDGRWHSAVRGSGGFSMNQLYGCFDSLGASTANPVTSACSCPVGASMVQISDSGPLAFPHGRTVGFLCIG